MNKQLKTILEAIDTKTVKKKIVTPCKRADATYRCQNPVPENFQQFQKECIQFWTHLFNSYHNVTQDIMTWQDALGFATTYIERAFSRNGGMRYAFHKATTESFNSIKFYITDMFVNEAVERYVSSILTTHVNPLNYEEIETLMTAYVQEFDIQLEKKGDLQWLIANYETILRSHAKRHGQLEIDRQVGAVVE